MSDKKLVPQRFTKGSDLRILMKNNEIAEEWRSNKCYLDDEIIDHIFSQWQGNELALLIEKDFRDKLFLKYGF